MAGWDFFLLVDGPGQDFKYWSMQSSDVNSSFFSIMDVSQNTFDEN